MRTTEATNAHRRTADRAGEHRTPRVRETRPGHHTDAARNGPAEDFAGAGETRDPANAPEEMGGAGGLLHAVMALTVSGLRARAVRGTGGGEEARLVTADH